MNQWGQTVSALSQILPYGETVNFHRSKRAVCDLIASVGGSFWLVLVTTTFLNSGCHSHSFEDCKRAVLWHPFTTIVNLTRHLPTKTKGCSGCCRWYSPYPVSRFRFLSILSSLNYAETVKKPKQFPAVNTLVIKIWIFPFLHLPNSPLLVNFPFLKKQDETHEPECPHVW